MNVIEKRKSQLKMISIIGLVVGLILSVVGVILLSTSGIGKDLSVIKLVFGILLILLGVFGVGLAIYLIWISNALIATKGSVAEDNLGEGTVNMNKCENCGAEVEPGVKICAKCEENLKP